MQLIITRTEHKAGNGRYFKTMDTGFFADNRLSAVACKLLGYLLSKPDEGWDLNWPDILRAFKEKEGTVRKAARCLKKFGYLLKVFKNGQCGKLAWGWVVYEVPLLPEERPVQAVILLKGGWHLAYDTAYIPNAMPGLPAVERLRWPAPLSVQQPVVKKPDTGETTILVLSTQH